jgi:hypothetical protein
MKVHKLVELSTVLSGRGYKGDLSDHTGVCEAGKSKDREVYVMFPSGR